MIPHPVLWASLILFIAGCANDRSKGEYKSLNVGGKEIVYKAVSCKPNVKWDGFDVAVEGLEFPNQPGHPLKFSVGKVTYKDTSIREINATVVYLEGLLDSTCQTLIRLQKEDSILEYSKERDRLMAELVNYLAALEKAPTEERVIALSKDAKKTAAK